jgi:outer membrane protein OmpA-like peptidoglycan-associated protein
MKALFIHILLFAALTGHSQSSFTIHFDFNKYNLTPAAKSQLDSFLLGEKENLPTLGIQLNGHCDAIGSHEYNNLLSQQRVRAVKKYLLNKGIEEINIGDEIGHGKKEPLNENKTEEQRQENRRVELSFFRVVTTNPPVISLKEKIADSTVNSGTNIVLKNINFVGGRHQFLPESYPMLQELLDAMRTYPKLIIRIEGHICCQDGPGDGLDQGTGINNLSEARAKAVMDYLVANDIDEKRLSFRGFGHAVPLYPFPENSEEEQKLNRRVEIKIISK